MNGQQKVELLSILFLLASYILLNIYFDWRIQKKIKEYQDRIDKWQKNNQ